MKSCRLHFLEDARKAKKPCSSPMNYPYRFTDFGPWSTHIGFILDCSSHSLQYYSPSFHFSRDRYRLIDHIPTSRVLFRKITAIAALLACLSVGSTRTGPEAMVLIREVHLNCFELDANYISSNRIHLRH